MYVYLRPCNIHLLLTKLKVIEVATNAAIYNWAKPILQHMGTGENDKRYQEFSDAVVKRMKDPPFNCVEECKGSQYQAVCLPLFLFIREADSEHIHEIFSYNPCPY